LVGWMDEQPVTRYVNDLFQMPILRAENAVAVDGREKDDHEMAPFKRARIRMWQQRAERVLDTLQGQEFAALHSADILNGAVARAKKLRRASGDGATFRFNAAGKQGVERRIRPQRPVRLGLVQAGGIFLAINVAKQP